MGSRSINFEKRFSLRSLRRGYEASVYQFDHEREPLATVIASAVEAAEREHDVSIKLTEDLPAESLVDAVLETALDELLSLVGEQELSDPPTLAARRASDSGLVTISLRGRDILLEPAVAAIYSGSEEVLRHSLGLRIWIVRWSIESMNGTVSVQDSDGHETVIELAVPVVGSQDAG